MSRSRSSALSQCVLFFLAGVGAMRLGEGWDGDVLDLKDSNGRVRVRVGQLADRAFGWTVLDESGQVVAGLESGPGGCSLSLGDGNGGGLKCQIGPKESEVSLASGSWRAFWTQDVNGVMAAGYCRTSDKDLRAAMTLGFKPGPKGGGHLRLFQAEGGGSGLLMGAEGGGVGLRLVQDSDVKAQLVVDPADGSSQLLLGKRLFGVLIQSLGRLGSSIDVCSGAPALRLESNDRGVGMVVGKEPGKHQVRVGVKADGEAVIEKVMVK